MQTIAKVFLVVALLTLSAGCATDGSIQNPFATDDPAQPQGNSYFYSEFEDIPVPNELSEKKGDTFITFAHSGVKCGVQSFSGRVEMVSLMNTMRRYLANNGWTLRSLLRSKESLLVFEKPDRIASIQFSDGLINTEMRVFVSARLQGDTSTVEIPTSFETQKLSQ